MDVIMVCFGQYVAWSHSPYERAKEPWNPRSGGLSIDNASGHKSSNEDHGGGLFSSSMPLLASMVSELLDSQVEIHILYPT